MDLVFPYKKDGLMVKWCDVSSALWYMRVCLAREVPLTVLIHRYSLPIYAYISLCSLFET